MQIRIGPVGDSAAHGHLDEQMVGPRAGGARFKPAPTGPPPPTNRQTRPPSQRLRPHGSNLRPL